MARQRAGLPPPAQAGLWTTSQAASVLGVSERTVERLVSSGRIASIKIGGSRRFAPEDVHKALADAGHVLASARPSRDTSVMAHAARRRK
jgi:excisionase family DNA binding protein